MPWVRLHGTKDYLDMVTILEKYPSIHQTFNLVPSLLEQIEDYTNRTVKDKFLELSFKPANELTAQDKKFISDNFFSINTQRVISIHPRFYELYFKNLAKKEFSAQDYLDLQVWFNLAWIDPVFRQNRPELTALVNKARFFTEEEKHSVLNAQTEILEEIIPAYKKFIEKGQVEVTVSPYYHPILPLLYNTKIAREAKPKTILPKINFSYPQDTKQQIDDAVKFYQNRFTVPLSGMWPSEESVSEHILAPIIQSGVKWIVADEGILFKSLKKRKRDTRILYQPYLLKREDGDLNIVFRDRNLSDLIGFVYYNMKAEDAVNDFIRHLENINNEFKGQDLLVTVALDGENAWEYYPNDGHDFLELLYQRIMDCEFIKATTIKEYLQTHESKSEIKRLAAGSWIYGEFGKWIGNPLKARAWEWLAQARKELENPKLKLEGSKLDLAWKQMYILEGSDWFCWYGEDTNGAFDKLFRTHLSNFYQLIGKDLPEYLNKPLSV